MSNASARLLLGAIGILLATPISQSTTTPTIGTPGNAPTSLPSDIPVYPGAQFLKSGTQGGMDVYFFTSQDSFAKVMTFYQQQMPKYGWRERPVPTPAADPLGDYIKGQRHALIESRAPSPPASAHGSGPTAFSITVGG